MLAGPCLDLRYEQRLTDRHREKTDTAIRDARLFATGRFRLAGCIPAEGF